MASQGYSYLAQTMSAHSELAIFRRFNTLNLQNILYLQAELTYLEKELKELVERDRGVKKREDYEKDWYALAKGYVYEEGEDDEEEGRDWNEDEMDIDGDSKGGMNEDNSSSGYIGEEGDVEREQWEKMLQIRKVLFQYNKHLAQQVFLTNLQPPKTYDLKFFRSWWKRPGLGNHPLESRDAESWDPEYTEDLLAIKRKESTDPFSRWVIYSFIPFFHHKIYKRWKKPLLKYASESSSEPLPLREGTEKSTGERLSVSMPAREGSKKASSRVSVANSDRHNSKKTGSSTPTRQDSQDSQKTAVNPTMPQHSPDLNSSPNPIRQDPEITIDSTPSDDTDLEACKSAQIYRYEDSKIARVVHIITIVIASMLPITSILILYFVTNTRDRMAISVAFTGLFSCSLAMMTRASRMEIFAATSAFAAVQVVFMTGSNGYVN